MAETKVGGNERISSIFGDKKEGPRPNGQTDRQTDGSFWAAAPTGGNDLLNTEKSICIYNECISVCLTTLPSVQGRGSKCISKLQKAKQMNEGKL